MSEFFLAPALVELRAELDKVFPSRDKSSDGWIGDASHAAHVSDHNPCWPCGGRSHGIVRAIDVDNNGRLGQITPVVTKTLEATIGDPRVWYVIWNGKIYSRTYGWSPRVYTGASPHLEHVHVSLNGANGVPGDPGNFDTSSWGITGTRGPRPARLPAVSLADVQRAARRNHPEDHPVQVRRVQRALDAKGSLPVKADGIFGPHTRQAYAAWQRRLGYAGSSADGIPGQTSLTRLGAHRFRVIR